MNIIITGASRGIGYETAKLLSAEHKVISISRNAEKNKFLGVIPIAFDFEKGNITKDLLPKILSSLSSGREANGEVVVDVLINNAATLINKPFEKTTREDFERIFSVNLFSIAELTQALIPYLISKHSSKEKQRSHVLNIASMGGIQGSVKFAGISAYSSSKGALITLAECLAEEYKDRNISFNTIAFGAVQTEMLEEAFPGFKAPITPEEAAKFVAAFALTGNNYFNGKILQMALSTP
jgi:3-oxoacyl-[acyl-carrier protein] reductase